MAFAKTTGSVTTLADLLAAFDTFATGIGWTVVETGTSAVGTAYSIYHSTGESTLEDVYIGVTTYYKSDTLCGFHFEAYPGLAPSCSCLGGFTSHPGAAVLTPAVCCCSFCLVPYVALRNAAMTYWFIGDLDMLAGMVSISPYYLGFYLGLPVRLNSRLHDPFPVIVDGSGTACYPTFTCWSTCHKNIGRASDGACCRCGQLMWGGAEWIPYRVKSNCCPISDNVINFPSNSLAATCLTNDQRLLVPILLSNIGGDRGTYKWVYKTYGGGLAGEDTISVGGNQYRCFPDPASPADPACWVVFRDYA